MLFRKANGIAEVSNTTETHKAVSCSHLYKSIRKYETVIHMYVCVSI